nr:MULTISPECIES: glyoxalase [Frankia]
MATEGVEGMVVETHNWGRAARFFQALGFTLEFETDHGSGLLRAGDGPYVFLREVPAGEVPRIQPVLTVADADALRLDPAVEVVTPFEETHYGTREMTVRDPDGRTWSLQAPTEPTLMRLVDEGDGVVAAAAADLPVLTADQVRETQE